MKWKFWEKKKEPRDPYRFGECPHDCPYLNKPIMLEESSCLYKKINNCFPGYCNLFKVRLWSRHPDCICWAPKECKYISKNGVNTANENNELRDWLVDICDNHHKKEIEINLK